MEPHLKDIDLIAGDPDSVALLDGREYVDFYIGNQDILDGSLEVRFLTQDRLEISAKSVFMGMITFGGVTIKIYPKVFSSGSLDESAFNLLTSFFLKPDQKYLRERISQNVDLKQTGSFFDWYFYLLLTDLYKVVKSLNREIFIEELQEVFGIKGRIDFALSLQANAGLIHKHICHVSDVSSDLFLLGIVKSYIKQIKLLSKNREVKSIATKCLGFFNDVNEITTSKSNLNKFNQQKALIVRKNKKLSPVIGQIFSILESLLGNVTPLRHFGFSFNLSKVFEDAVLASLKKASTAAGIECYSGNQHPEVFLNLTSDLSYDDEKGALQKTLKIKPDVILKDSNTDRVISILDTKYKHSRDEKGLPIVRSQDIYQMISYWLHFRRSNSSDPVLVLIHPAQISALDKDPVCCTGKALFETGIKETPHATLLTLEVDFVRLTSTDSSNEPTAFIGEMILKLLHKQDMNKAA